MQLVWVSVGGSGTWQTIVPASPPEPLELPPAPPAPPEPAAPVVLLLEELLLDENDELLDEDDELLDENDELLDEDDELLEELLLELPLAVVELEEPPVAHLVPLAALCSVKTSKHAVPVSMAVRVVRANAEPVLRIIRNLPK